MFPDEDNSKLVSGNENLGSAGDGELRKDDEVEEVVDESEFIPPFAGYPPPPNLPFPPPPGMPFPPPPPGWRPFPPPGRIPPYGVPQGQFAIPSENESDEENLNGDGRRDYIAVPPVDRFSRGKAPNIKRIDSSKISKDKTLDKIQFEGERKAAANIGKENVASTFGLFFKILYTVLILGLLIAVCVGIICYYYADMTKSELSAKEEFDEKNLSEMSSARLWKLPKTEANETIRRYYDACGNLDDISNTRDFLMKGSIHIGKDSKTFYCIKKPGYATFLKFGNDKETKSYFINELNGNVEELFDGTISGRKSKLSGVDALVSRAYMEFDSRLFSKAFVSFEQISPDLPYNLAYEGNVEYKGDKCDVLVATESNGVVVKYYFDSKTALLSALEMSLGGRKVEIVYGDYNMGGEMYKLPESAVISLDGKEHARINFDFVVRNKGAMFPR